MTPITQRPLEVTFFHRKPYAVGNYSVEAIFADVRSRLAGSIHAKLAEGRFFSQGLLRRIYLCAEAFFRQGEVNHITGDINFVGILLRKRRTVQTILDCVSVARSTGLKRAVLRLFWVALPVRRCAVVTAISEATRQEILKLVPDCPPEKIVVVPVAISGRFQRSPKPFNEACPRILQVGTAPNKNLPRLIEALQGMRCQLDIIGRHVPEYEDQLEALGIAYTYRWQLTEDEILLAYQQADIVTLVSTYEGFGMPILEGQAVGRPVITSGLLSMPEVAGDAACLVDPLDVAAIRAGFERIIGDAAYRDGLVEKGYRNVLRFDPDVIANAYLDIYRRVAAR
jgi:glycosyltransferase involved in cell wall biosynthesis